VITKQISDHCSNSSRIRTQCFQPPMSFRYGSKWDLVWLAPMTTILYSTSVPIMRWSIKNKKLSTHKIVNVFLYLFPSDLIETIFLLASMTIRFLWYLPFCQRLDWSVERFMKKYWKVSVGLAARNQATFPSKVPQTALLSFLDKPVPGSLDKKEGRRFFLLLKGQSHEIFT
jgi:hypothetical protein